MGMLTPQDAEHSQVESSQRPVADGRVKNGPRGRAVRISFDGQSLCAYEGETVAAALLAAGRRVWRYSGGLGEPRGLFCGMGVCFDCVVQIDGRPNVRACQTLVQESMRIETQRGVGSWEMCS